MAYCGKCGAMLNGESFCPNCGASVNMGQQMQTSAGSHSANKTGTWKKVVLGLVVVVIAIFAITRFTSTVNEPCDWCGGTPSIAYKMSDGSYAYVCKDCSKECFLCGKKATKHFENLLGTMTFVCKDCYKELSGQ